MKNKLSLDLNALTVDTFETSPAALAARGTVQGNDSPPTPFTETLVRTTTDPNQNCMCYSSDPCVNTHVTACGPDCI